MLQCTKEEREKQVCKILTVCVQRRKERNNFVSYFQEADPFDTVITDCITMPAKHGFKYSMSISVIL